MNTLQYLLFWSALMAPILILSFGVWWELRKARKAQEGMRDALSKLVEHAKTMP